MYERGNKWCLHCRKIKLLMVAILDSPKWILIFWTDYISCRCIYMYLYKPYLSILCYTFGCWWPSNSNWSLANYWSSSGGVVGLYIFFMMTSSNGNIFRLTGLLCGEFTGHRWIPLTKASSAELWCFLWPASESTVEQTIVWDNIAPIMTLL